MTLATLARIVIDRGGVTARAISIADGAVIEGVIQKIGGISMALAALARIVIGWWGVTARTISIADDAVVEGVI